MNAKSDLTPDPSRVASLERALSILSVFETSETPVTLAQIAKETGLYKSTILRLIGSFEDHGYIQRSADGATYAVGPTAFRLGAIYKKSFELDEAIETTLEDLVRKGTESASFHILDRDHRLCILRKDSNHPTLDRVSAGDRLPLDRGAAGKVLRAYSGDDSSEMQGVREQGIAVSHGEVDPSCAAISVPVFGQSNELIGAISVSGPKERFTDESVANMSQLLFEASRNLSRLAISERRVNAGSLRA
jgi:DNA-binding IclR family transcriptional regulator